MYHHRHSNSGRIQRDNKAPANCAQTDWLALEMNGPAASYVCVACHGDTDAYAQAVKRGARVTHRHADRRPREQRKSAASTPLIPPPSVQSCTPAVQSGDPPPPTNDCSAHYTHTHTHTHTHCPNACISGYYITSVQGLKSNYSM